MQGIGGDFRVRKGKPEKMNFDGKKLSRDVYFYNDYENEITPLKSIRKPIYIEIN